MERYINPEKIKLTSATWIDGGEDILVPLIDVKKAIAQTPTEDDVVKVVRCKDCKWCEDLLMSGMYCNHPDNRNPINCLPDDFCNCGERKEQI